MDRPFPFGFPSSTAFYLVAYVATLVIHVVFMNYVLAGAAALALKSVVSGKNRPELNQHDMRAVLRDWLPFAFSAAITAGVAPLLFLQILYQRHFYTANLLLFHRWMAFLPVLMVGFYLLYLLRSKTYERQARIMRFLVSMAAFLCFAFTAYSWSENHMLSQNEEVWVAFYGSGKMFYHHREVLWRLSFWLAGSIPVMTTLVSWQLWYPRGHAFPTPTGEARRASACALVGLLLSVVLGAVYFQVTGEETRTYCTSPAAWPYLVAAIAGVLIQVVAWLSIWQRRQLSARQLGLASAGMLLTIVGVTVVRECIRLGSIDVKVLLDGHARAAAVGGRNVFLFFLAANAILLAWALGKVRRRLRSAVPGRPPE